MLVTETFLCFFFCERWESPEVATEEKSRIILDHKLEKGRGREREEERERDWEAGNL